MKAYASVYESLGLPSELIDCAMGRIPSPVVGLESPAQWYGYPPALIPIWSDGSRPTYIGCWKHWFVERPSTFVKMYVASGRLTVEIARDADQLLCIVAMMAISVADGVEPELEGFARRVGIANLQEIDEVSLQSGDDPKGFVNLEQFKASVPLESVATKADYDGDFALSDLAANTDWLSRSCSFELSENVQSELKSVDVTLPAWLGESEDKRQVFDSFLADGDLASAWLTLNSHGWSIEAARSGIQDLERVARDRQFTELADAWLQVADVGAGSY